MRYLFTNNPSHLFQINPMHAYRWPNGAQHGPDARGSQLWPRHVMPTWLCRASPLACPPIWLNGHKMLKNSVIDGVWTHALIEEGRETLDEVV
jgi:hypothetical protein